MPNALTGYGPLPSGLTQTSLTSSAASTVTQKTGSTAIAVQAITNNVYWTFDGSTPSSTNGMTLIAASQPLVLPIGSSGNTNLTHKFQAAAGTAVVNFQSLGS